MNQHVDLYRVEFANRRHVLVARVEEGFNVVVDDGDLAKRLRTRIETSAFQPKTLDELAMEFDAPQLLASQPHPDSECPFVACGVAKLDTQPPEFRFTDHGFEPTTPRALA